MLRLVQTTIFAYFDFFLFDRTVFSEIFEKINTRLLLFYVMPKRESAKMALGRCQF
jgi:hypothetical protein